MRGHWHKVTLILAYQQGTVDSQYLPTLASKVYSDFNPESDRHLSVSRSSYYFMRHTMALVLGVAQPHPEDLIIGKRPRPFSYVPATSAISKVLATAS